MQGMQPSRSGTIHCANVGSQESDDGMTKKNGRPFAPRNADECRLAISRETTFGCRERKLAKLYKLLRSFTDAEKANREDARTAAINAANALKSADIELRRQEYLRRFAAAPLGQRMLLAKVERLEEELASVKANSGSMPTLTRKDGTSA